jgi:hypothetical protein
MILQNGGNALVCVELWTGLQVKGMPPAQASPVSLQHAASTPSAYTLNLQSGGACVSRAAADSGESRWKSVADGWWLTTGV